MTPEQLQKIQQQIEEAEGRIPWLYRDSAVEGNATCGVGHLVASLGEAQQLPFRPSITAKEWAALMTAPRGCKASFYQGETMGRLTPAAIDALLVGDLERTQAALRVFFAEYDDYPDPAQAALLDMAFNLGVAGLLKFTHLCCAVKLRDWAACAVQSHRVGISEQRNRATFDLFVEASKEDK